jgi:hypothetical protein
LKQLFYISLFFLCLVVKPNTATALEAEKQPEGLYVRGEMSITKGGQMATFGDVFLDSAKIVGQGVLSFNGHLPQHLSAKASQVANILINNTNTVSVKGDLLITESLNIQKGIFDTRLGKLSFTNSAIVNISNEGKWIQAKREFLPDFSNTTVIQHYTFPIALAHAIATEVFYSTKAYAKGWATYSINYTNNIIDKINQPPEV